MLALLIALIVTVIVAYMILHKMKAQTVLFAGGIVLMIIAVLMGYPLLEAKNPLVLSGSISSSSSKTP
jgi:DcuC family C4-dicarboxylate transporter